MGNRIKQATTTACLSDGPVGYVLSPSESPRLRAVLARHAVICLQTTAVVTIMPHHQTDSARLLAMARKRAVLRSGDVAAQGIHTGTLTRLARAGTLERVGPGRYRLAQSARATEHHDLVVGTTGGSPLRGVPRVGPPSSTASGRSCRRRCGWRCRVARACRDSRRRRCAWSALRPKSSTSVSRSTVREADRSRLRRGSHHRGLLSIQEQGRARRGARSADGSVARETPQLDELHRIATRLRVQRVMQPYLEAVVM